MSNYLNKGNKAFQESLDSPIYVDKTGFIGYTNSVVSTKFKYICVTRPRRFGKSTAAEMLRAYYCRTCDSHAQFDGLEVSKTEKYEKHINKYNVIHINLTDVLSDEKDIETSLEELKIDLVSDLVTEFPEITFTKNTLIPMLETVYDTTKIEFVFIIDEWDCPFRERKPDTEGQKKYTVFLRDILKDKDYVALTYMTGILPIKKLCTESSLNMFREYSMEIPGPVKQYFGFTAEEVKALCDERVFSYKSIKDWYDGYVFESDTGEKLHMFNANSVVSAIDNRQLTGYWPRTESFENLEQYIKLNHDGLHDVLIKLLDDGIYDFKDDEVSNKPDTVKSLEDTLLLLVHLGYLAYDVKHASVRIPNVEIKREFIRTISDMGDDALCRLVKMSKDIVKATTSKDGDRLAKYIAKFHEDHAATRHFNDESTLADVVRFAYIAAQSDYWIESEAQAGKGYADLAFKPYDVEKNVPLVIELKYNKKAETAIEQIEDRHYVKYFDKFQLKSEILFVGINYDSGKEENGSDGTYNVMFETVKI